YGIYLEYSNNNIISENKLIGNDFCITENHCSNNHFENNDCGRKSAIPGFSLFFLFGIIISVLFILSKKIKKSWKNNSKF
ncbi:MAG: hypothetical protein ACFFC3_09940, partial [Candidatus Odinarchaeota archaeon]